MANVNAPYGFRAVRHGRGGVLRRSAYRVASGSSAIYRGSPVKLDSNGKVVVAAAGDRLLGIADGVQYRNAAGETVFSAYWPNGQTTLGSEDGTIWVMDDPDTLFRVQSAGTPGITHIGNLANHVVGTGSTVTGQSGDTLSGTMGTSAAGFRILDFAKDADNEVGQYADLIVQIFQHELAYHGQATPGV